MELWFSLSLSVVAEEYPRSVKWFVMPSANILSESEALRQAG
jgi:hypothetical protein